MIQLTVTGHEEVQAGVRRGSEVTASEVHDAMEYSMLLLESSMRRDAPRSTGQLAGSVTSSITGTGANLTGRVGPQAGYAMFVEKGTRPHWPPLNALAPWARRHGVPLFLAARAIARRGTRAQPFVGPAWEKNERAITARFQQIAARIGARILP